MQWRVAMAVTALKLLLVPAYRSTDFEVSCCSRLLLCDLPVPACKHTARCLRHLNMRLLSPCSGASELDGNHEQPPYQPVVSSHV